MGKKAAGAAETGSGIFRGLSGAFWRNLAENLTDIIFLVDESGGIEYSNRVPGGGNHDTLIGRSIFEFIGRGHRPRAARALKRAVVSLQRDKYEARGIAADGSFNWYEVTVGPIQRDAGSRGAILTARNIDDRKKMEDQVRHIRKMLEMKATIREESLKQTNIDLSREVEARRATESRLRGSRKQLRELFRHMESIRESERMELAHDLHDELGATLTALKLNINILLDETPCPESSHMHMRKEVNLRLDKAINHIRSVIQQLRPPVLDDLGLIEALKWQAGEVSAASGLNITVEILPEEFAVEQETATNLFRIYQELLTNIVRHARASRVNIRLRRRSREMVLKIKDDGRGMPLEVAARGHSLGILGIRERIKRLEGTLRIRNLKTGGTAILIRVPAADHSLREAE